MAGYCKHGIKISVFTKFVDILASYASHRRVNFVLHGVSESFRMYYYRKTLSVDEIKSKYEAHHLRVVKFLIV
jgi:hypothetical protein